MSPIFLFGEKYFDVYTIEAGREATAQARFPGGTCIVEQLFHPKPQWLNDIGNNDDSHSRDGSGRSRRPPRKFGKRISLGIANRDEEKGRYVFADTVSVAFRSIHASDDPLDNQQIRLSNTSNESRPALRIPALRIGFYSLPNATEGDLDRRHHGRRFPGLGSLFQAHLIQCLTGMNPADSGHKHFYAIFKAAKGGTEKCEEYRSECLRLLENIQDEAGLARRLEDLNKGSKFGDIPFRPERLPLGSHRSQVLYVCDYGDLTKSMCDKVNGITDFSYLLYRASHLGCKSYAYRRLIASSESSKTKLITVTKAEHLRGFGIRLNPYDWFQATADLVSELDRARRAGPPARNDDSIGTSLRHFLFRADFLVVRFGLEGFALIQRVDPAEERPASEEHYVTMIDEKWQTPPPTPIR